MLNWIKSPLLNIIYGLNLVFNFSHPHHTFFSLQPRSSCTYIINPWSYAYITFFSCNSTCTKSTFWQLKDSDSNNQTNASKLNNYSQPAPQTPLLFLSTTHPSLRPPLNTLTNHITRPSLSFRNPSLVSNMKTINFQTPAREENASMVHKSVSHLDLSLGISSPNVPHDYKNAPTTGKRRVSFQPEDIEASPAYKKSVSLSSRSAFDYSYLFSHCPTGFVDPWSLAARQQKAAVEQAHLKANPNSSSSNM